MVYVIPHKIYVTAAYATSPPPFNAGGAANIRYSMMALVKVPIISHGRNLPHFVLVFATITPMKMIPMAMALTPMIS